MSDIIKVGIRMRPKFSNEADKIETWKVKDEKCICEISPPNEFSFDRVFNENEDNSVVYNDLCSPIVDSVMQGYNGTIFAYGQTSSGKTYTMMGDHNGIIEGIVQLTIEHIFKTIENTPEREFLLRVTILEIYKEKVFDLLSKKKDDDLILRINKYGNIDFQYSGTKTSLEEKIVNKKDQILELMFRGLRKRHTGDTEMNQRSSRSHCIFRMIIESRLRGEEDAVVNVSQLNLVDLAGSENVKSIQKDRIKEGLHINLSLSSLSQVIKQLSEKDDNFINYRDSKLTRILQNSLGGNSLTAILCTVTPFSKENNSTIQFALRAKKVKTKAKKNEIFTEQALLKKYEHKIKELSAELEASKEKGKALEEKTKQNENLKREIEALKSKIVPISQNFQKSNRRETWGGNLDARHFQKAFGLPRNPLPSLTNLSVLEEEPEGDFDITNLDFDLNLKQKKSSIMSTNTVMSCGSPKIVSDVETQTEIDTNSSMTNNFDEVFEDIMEMVATLKTEVLRLENELSELNEYTTLEQQAIRAESELHKELEALRNENNILRKALESSSSTLLSEVPISSSPGSFKTSECDSKMGKTVSVFRDETDESNNEKSLHKELDSSRCRNQLNATSLDCEKSIFDVTCKLVSNNSRDEFADSADESMKSHFLALYDECLESETVSKLKTDIESLKYDNSLKDQQINLLKDKIEIKDQMIMSLKDEITLVKTDGVESVTNNNPESNLYTNDSYKSDSYSQMKEYVDNQTSPLKFMQHVHMDETCQTSFNSLLMSPKECQTSPLKSEKICFIHRSYQTDFRTLPMMNSRECQTSPLKSLENIHLHKICQTEFIGPVKNIKNFQTSPIKFEEASYICKICQTASNSPVKSIKKCQTSPLKLEKNVHIHQICQTDFNDPEKSIKECQTSPLKVETKEHVHEVCQTDFDSSSKSAEDCETTPLKSSHANMKCCRCSGITASDTVDMSPLKSSNSDSKAEFEQKITTLNEHIMTLEFNVKGKEEYAELLSSQLDLKNEEVVSLNLKLSDAELNLKKIEIEFSKLTEGISTLKRSLSQLTFMCEMLNDVESENEFAKLKKLSEISSSQYSIPLYDVSLIQNMILKLNSCMEVNASKIINLSAKLKAVENELFAIQKQNNAKLHCTSLENSSKHNQTEILNGIDSAKMIENNENKELAPQFKSEIKSLEEKNKELKKSYEELKQKMKDLEESHSAEIFALQMQCQTSKSDWNIKTMQLINDLEVKYEQELNDQETKFTTDLHKKLLDAKEEHLKQIFKKEVEFKEHIAEVKSLHSEELLQLQKQIKDIEDQLFTESVEKENLRHQLEKEKEHEIIIIRKKFEEVVEKYKDRMRQYKDENSQLKYRQKCYADEIDKLKKENILDKDEPVTQQLIENLNEISNEKDLLLKKYTIAKQHICEMKEELKKKHKHLSDQEELLQKLSCTTTKELEETNKKLLYDLDQKKAKIMSLESTTKEQEETNKKLLYEIDQKKAKIMSLETNNANLVVELKKQKDMRPKTDIPAKSENYCEKKSEQTREHGAAKENQVVRKAALDDEENQKENETPNRKNADQEAILCIGGGSGPANMVKNFWLEGVIHKKEKEIAKLRKELADHKCETKTSHLISSEKKKNAEIGNKAPEVPISFSPLQEMDEQVTVHAVGNALQPYPEGAIPKVQAKQILKERNRRSCGKPYDQHPRLLHSKKQDVNSERQQVLSKPKENKPISALKTKEDVVKVLAEGEPECKQM